MKNWTQYITESITTTKQNSDHVFVLSSFFPKKIVNYWFGVLFFFLFFFLVGGEREGEELVLIHGASAFQAVKSCYIIAVRF